MIIMISALNHGVYGYSPVRKSGGIFAKSTSNRKRAKETFTLNTAYKTKVLEFVSELAQNINSSKLATRDLESAFEDLEKDIKYKDERTIKDNFSNKGEQFVHALNNFVEDLETNESMPYIDNYMENVNITFEENKELLNNFGFTKENGKFYFSKSKLKGNSISNLLNNSGEYSQIFKQLNQSSVELSNRSVTEHINFKDLSYYFNYGISIYQNNSMELLGTGTIVNLKL